MGEIPLEKDFHDNGFDKHATLMQYFTYECSFFLRFMLQDISIVMQGKLSSHT